MPRALTDTEFDDRLRTSAFAYLRAVQLRTGGPVRFDDVSQFRFEGIPVPLLDRQRGIRKPRVLDAALSFRTVFAADPRQRPYDDSPGADGYLRYKWRGTDPDHAENVALRRAQQSRLPMIWFHGVEPGVYLPYFPVWLAAEEREEHQFVVALDTELLEAWEESVGEVDHLRRAYSERLIQERVHQPLFRARVLSAYSNRCALCRLRHYQLLDAAHIRGDAEGGEPVVTNGIAMCRIHHAAFDFFLIGIRPDTYSIHVRSDIRSEEDGPTLLHAFQGLHDHPIELPRRRAAHPDRDLLAERYEQFRAAS